MEPSTNERLRRFSGRITGAAGPFAAQGQLTHPPSGGRAVNKSICGWGVRPQGGTRTAGAGKLLGSSGGQRGQRSGHGATSTQRKQVGSDGMTQTHLLALRACISGSSERKHASPRCPVGLRDLLAGLKGPHTIALPDNTNQSTRVIQIDLKTARPLREGRPVRPGRVSEPTDLRAMVGCRILFDNNSLVGRSFSRFAPSGSHVEKIRSSTTNAMGSSEAHSGAANDGEAGRSCIGIVGRSPRSAYSR